MDFGDFGFWGFWILDFGDFGFGILGFWILGILDLGFWDFGEFGFWILGILGILDFGILGILDFGFWGFWILDLSRGCTTRRFGDGAWRSEARIPPGSPLGATSKLSVSHRIGVKIQGEKYSMQKYRYEGENA